MEWPFDQSATKYRISVLYGQETLALASADNLYDSVMELSQWILDARKRAKLTQEQLADELGVTKSNVSGWENGRHEPNWRQILRIRERTGMPLPIDDDGPQEPQFDWPFSTPCAQVARLDAVDLEILDNIVALFATRSARRTGQGERAGIAGGRRLDKKKTGSDE